MKVKFGKMKNEDQLQVDVVKKKDIWGVPNFLPSREAGEDEHSNEHYIHRLKDQVKMNVAKRNKEINNRKNIPITAENVNFRNEVDW